MKWLNTNLLHNVLNIAITLIAALETMDLMPLIGEERALKLVAGLGVAKIVINVVRDGLAGLIKDQPPVR